MSWYHDTFSMMYWYSYTLYWAISIVMSSVGAILQFYHHHAICDWICKKGSCMHNCKYLEIWYSSIETWHLHACEMRLSGQISRVTRKLYVSKSLKYIYIYTCVTLESLDKFIGSLASCTQGVSKFVLLLMNCTQALNKFIEPFASCTRAHVLMHL